MQPDKISRHRASRGAKPAPAGLDGPWDRSAPEPLQGAQGAAAAPPARQSLWAELAGVPRRSISIGLGLAVLLGLLLLEGRAVLGGRS